MADEEAYPYEKDPDGSAEVAGEPGGVTLLDCIRDGKIETPGPLSYHDWLKWRKGPGRRPGLRRDGRGLTSAKESALWRSVTEELYGEQEVEALEEEGLVAADAAPAGTGESETETAIVPAGRPVTLAPGSPRPGGQRTP